MQEKGTSRAWTQEEDDLLVQVMNRNGGFENWKEVATLIPGRTNKACRKRWLHSLSPDLRKSAWTPREDALLVALHKRHKNKWSTIARFIPGRTDDACSKRFREALDPRLKKDPWTQAEDAKLLQLYSQLGPKWKEVGEEMQRSGLGCRNRLRLLERRASARAHQEEPPPEGVQGTDVEEPDAGSAVSLTHSPESSTSTQEPHSSLQGPPLPFSPPEADAFTIAEEQMTFTGSVIFDPQNIPLENAPLQYNSSSFPTASSTDGAQQHIPSQDDTILTDMELPQSQDYSMLFSPYNDFATFGDFFMNTPYPDSDASPNLGVLDLNSPHSSRSSPMPEGNRATSRHDLESFFYLPTFTNPMIHCTSSIPLDDRLASSSLVDQTATISITSSIDTPASNLVNTDPLAMLSPSRHYRHSAVRPRPRRRTPPTTDTRVSSVRPAGSDPNILPYACGYRRCWPRERFATSRELLYHSKTHEHEEEEEDDGTDRIFRCALHGCGKSWKSINGLQYHLQVSPAHFTEALSSKLQASASTSTNESESFRCPKPGCHKTYKQHGGLRYHLKHGHPKRTPEQLTDVPHTVGKSRRLRQRQERVEDTS